METDYKIFERKPKRADFMQKPLKDKKKKKLQRNFIWKKETPLKQVSEIAPKIVFPGGGQNMLRDQNYSPWSPAGVELGKSEVRQKPCPSTYFFF